MDLERCSLWQELRGRIMCPIESIPFSRSGREINVSIAQYWFLPRVNRGDRTTTTRDKCSRTLKRSWRTVSVVVFCSSSNTRSSSIASCDEVGSTAKMALKSPSEKYSMYHSPFYTRTRWERRLIRLYPQERAGLSVAHVTSSDGAQCSCCKGGKNYEIPE